MRSKVILGKEYDENLKETLVAILKYEGTKLVSKLGGFPGADFTSLTLDLKGEEICVEAETYMGLSIEGETDVVERLAKMVVEQQAKGIDKNQS